MGAAVSSDTSSPEQSALLRLVTITPSGPPAPAALLHSVSEPPCYQQLETPDPAHASCPACPTATYVLPAHTCRPALDPFTHRLRPEEGLNTVEQRGAEPLSKPQQHPAVSGSLTVTGRRLQQGGLSCRT